MTKFGLSVITLLFLTACSSKPQLLPDDGPSTHDIYHGNYGQSQQLSGNQYGGGGEYPIHSRPVSIAYPNMSAHTSKHLRELNQDFKKVPNPQILGYVYPHFNRANMPVPGYFTAFTLYEKDEYALMEEGAAEGLYQ